jgi:hypothetical protein
MVTSYQSKVMRKYSTDLIGFWPLNEESGTAVYDWSDSGYNGTSSGLVRDHQTRGFLGPDGDKCAQFISTASYIDLINAAPASATSGQTEGTLSLWVAVPQVHLAGTTKMSLAFLGADTANSISMYLDTTAYRFSCGYNAGSGDATYSTTYTGLAYNVDGGFDAQWPEWHHLGMTYSATNDSVVMFLDGSPSTGCSSLGTWTGNFATAQMVLGSTSTTIATGFTGWMSNFGWWPNRIMTTADMEDLADITV